MKIAILGPIVTRSELAAYDVSIAPHFDLQLKAGWNRLLFKVSTYNKEGWTDHRFSLRLMDLPTVPYDSKNLLWMTDSFQGGLFVRPESGRARALERFRCSCSG